MGASARSQQATSDSELDILPQPSYSLWALVSPLPNGEHSSTPTQPALKKRQAAKGFLAILHHPVTP